VETNFLLVTSFSVLLAAGRVAEVASVCHLDLEVTRLALALFLVELGQFAALFYFSAVSNVSGLQGSCSTYYYSPWPERTCSSERLSSPLAWSSRTGTRRTGNQPYASSSSSIGYHQIRCIQLACGGRAFLAYRAGRSGVYRHCQRSTLLRCGRSMSALHLRVDEVEAVVTITLRLAHIREVFAVELEDGVCAGLQCWRRRCGDGYDSSESEDSELHREYGVC